jgi:hypothetical protein
MTAGLHAVNLIDKVLNGIGRTGSFPTAGTLWVKLHTAADPGVGATGASANTTRVAVTFSASSGGSMAASSQPAWATWAAGTETLQGISLWDALTVGNCLWTGALTAPKTVNNGDTFTLTSLTLAITPVAA